MGNPTSDKTERRSVRVRGIVQGVGFRPFVFRLAEEEHLAGWVLNDALGVLAEVEGTSGHLDNFVRRIADDAPPLARVLSVESETVPATGETAFVIRPSDAGAARTALISPDVATCDDCLRELMDPADRRYRYPFINCTNCGPRYTIIRDIPYDRPKTTMAPFVMCDACQREYDDPRDRRFHAQPNACAACGPRLMLLDRSGREMQTADVVNRAGIFLHEGQIVAVKGLGGFHLACDATNDRAVRRLRERKNREEKPLAIMAPSVDVIARFAEVRAEDRRLLESPERPIVLLLKKQPSDLAESVAPHSRYVGVMLPYTPVHHLLLHEGFDALVMTSGNVSDEPICKSNDEATARLKDIADYFLVNDRDIHVTSDDSVVRADASGLKQMRRSRGYVPVPVPLDDGPVILAVGAELKNTVALTRGPFVFLSQHVGDIKNVETHDFFLRTGDHLQKILDVTPEIVAHDMHPDYLSTRYALGLDGVEHVAVQHHHAHIASCMVEHALADKVIGVSLDGTGYGTDGHTWGGEFLVADRKAFERMGRFEYLPLPGGDRATSEPWRSAFAEIVRAFGDDWRTLDIDLLRGHDERDYGALAQMIAKGVHCPLSSGAGRVFDAVSALIGVCDRGTYEGQPAIELEAVVADDVTDAYPYDVVDRVGRPLKNGDRPSGGGGTGAPPPTIDAWRGSCPATVDGGGLPQQAAGRWVVSFAPTFRAIVDDMKAGAAQGVISARFHNAVVNIVVDMVGRIAEKTGRKRVCLSGGVFQNRYLCDHIVPELTALDFEVFEQSIAPANDGGIALGQAAIARARTLVSSSPLPPGEG